MKKVLFIIITTFLILLGGIAYYVYLNNENQTIDSGEVFDSPKNILPFGLPTAQTSATKTKTIQENQTTNLPQTKPTPIIKRGLRIVTNGITDPGIDTEYKNQTTYQQDGKSLDATTDNYITVPNNTIPIGSRVYIINKNTGLDVWGIVGDIGPYGGISLYAAEQLGIWQPGMGLNLLPHTLVYKYYKN